MTFFSIGDLASSAILRRQNVQLKEQFGRLSQELSTGIAADLPRHLGGNYNLLGDLERGLRVNESYNIAAKEASLFTGAMQSALDRVQSIATSLSSDLLLAGGASLPTALSAASNSAHGELESVLSALNTTVAGRALFSGSATDTTPFASSDTFLTELKTAVATETTLGGILSAIDTWFDTPGGGFETLGYLGGSDNLASFAVGEWESVALGLRGDSQAIRDMIRNTAIAALASDPDLGYSVDLQSALITTAGENLINSQDDLSGIRADLGFAEARVEESRTRLSTEKTTLEMAKGELLAVDLYETATRLEEVQFQLESLYTATVRLSRLSLSEYM